MACCLTAANHYLNQYWLTIIEVLWPSPQTSFIGSAQGINLQNGLEKCTFEINWQYLIPSTLKLRLCGALSNVVMYWTKICREALVSVGNISEEVGDCCNENWLHLVLCLQERTKGTAVEVEENVDRAIFTVVEGIKQGEGKRRGRPLCLILLHVAEFNSLAPGRYGSHFQRVIFRLMK